MRMYRWSTEQWGSLRDTWDWTRWVPLLNDLGLDNRAAQSLAVLCQQGPAGRCEGNRLLWHFMKPAAPGARGYHHAPSMWMNAIRAARQVVDRPPESHMDFRAWAPHATLAGCWFLKQEYAPRNAQGIPTSWGAPGSQGPMGYFGPAPWERAQTANAGMPAAPAAPADPPIPPPAGPAAPAAPAPAAPAAGGSNNHGNKINAFS